MSRPTTVQEHLMDRSAAAVTRWHNTLTLKTESIAEHQFFVSEAASLICRLLWHYGIAEPNGLDTVTMAQMHDRAETEVGDITGKAKRHCPTLENAARIAELGAVQRELFGGLPEPVAWRYRYLMRRALVLRPKDDDLESQIVLYCDRLAAYAFVHQEVLLGNERLSELRERCLQEIEDLDWPWLVALRKAEDVI